MRRKQKVNSKLGRFAAMQTCSIVVVFSGSNRGFPKLLYDFEKKLNKESVLELDYITETFF